MAESDPLPDEEQRRKLCDMVALAFIEIRLLGWAGKAHQAADLADAFHNLPREMYGWGGWNRSVFRDILESYQIKYRDSDHKPLDYVHMFDEIFPEFA